MINNIKIFNKEDGEIIGVAGDNYRIIIDGEKSNNTFTVFDMLIPPGGGPAPHSHPEIQEWFYVIEGELLYKTEFGQRIVKEGGFVYIPYGGAIHCFHNSSDKMAHILCFVSPAGMENVFKIIGTPAKAEEFLPIPEMTPELEEKLKEANVKYNQTTYPMDYLDNPK